MTRDRALLDTNAAIDLLNDEPEIEIDLDGIQSLLLPLIVLGELEFGARNSGNPKKNLQAIEQLLRNSQLVIPDRDSAAKYGEIHTSIRRKGRPIPTNDLWIAALALQHGLPLVSRDQHFSVVDGLTIIPF